MLDHHTHVWPHQPGTPTPTYDHLARMCDAAAAVGIDQIAITEHAHRFSRIRLEVLSHWHHDDDAELVGATNHVLDVEGGADLDAYVEALVGAKERGLPILVGIEVDRIPGALEPMGALLDEYPFDIRLGSVHWLGSWLFDDYGTPVFAREWDRRETAAVWSAYCDAIEELATSGLADVLAHVDVVKVAGHRPPDVVAYERRLAEIIATTSTVVEISSAGWRKPADEMYPSPSLLDRLVEAGVGFTTASDAHVIEHLGWEYGRLRAELETRGVHELTTFEERTPRRVAL
jgi:histidinol-phosphatase (PHP family)